MALCGGSVAGEFVWMVDGVDYATTWVRCGRCGVGARPGRWRRCSDMEASLPFALLGLDSDNGGEFLNHHVLQLAAEAAATGVHDAQPALQEG